MPRQRNVNLQNRQHLEGMIQTTYDGITIDISVSVYRPYTRSVAYYAAINQAGLGHCVGLLQHHWCVIHYHKGPYTVVKHFYDSMEWNDRMTSWMLRRMSFGKLSSSGTTFRAPSRDCS